MDSRCYRLFAVDRDSVLRLVRVRLERSGKNIDRVRDADGFDLECPGAGHVSDLVLWQPAGLHGMDRFGGFAWFIGKRFAG